MRAPHNPVLITIFETPNAGDSGSPPPPPHPYLQQPQLPQLQIGPRHRRTCIPWAVWFRTLYMVAIRSDLTSRATIPSPFCGLDSNSIAVVDRSGFLRSRPRQSPRYPYFSSVFPVYVNKSRGPLFGRQVRLRIHNLRPSRPAATSIHLASSMSR